MEVICTGKPKTKKSCLQKYLKSNMELIRSSKALYDNLTFYSCVEVEMSIKIIKTVQKALLKLLSKCSNDH